MLLHLTTPAEWRAALSVGSLTPPSLVTDGFVHLSTPEQVHLPYERLYAGRADTIVLVVDEPRLAGAGEVRWEPGVPGDPASMRFPHLYGPLPTAAVTSVVPYGRPLPDPSDLPARAAAFDPSLARRRAAASIAVAGATVCVDPRVPRSYEHNCCWVDDPTGDWQAALRTRGLPRAVLPSAPPASLDGYGLGEERILVLDLAAPPTDPPPGIRVEPVTSEVMHRLWGPSWRRELPAVDDATVDDLLRREAIADAHVRVVDLAVVEDGAPVSSAQLRLDGATAAVEAVMTDPGRRGRGLSTAVVLTAVARARAAGCDLVHLVAAADDWPRRWYERLGFVDAGARWCLEQTS